MRHWIWIIVAALALAGCGNSTNGNSAGSVAVAPGNVDASATLPQNDISINGKVVQVNPVFVVDSLDQSPDGATPRQNATVSARDAGGQMVGLAVSGTDGTFQLNTQTAGMTSLDVRIDPNSTDPDLRVNVTGVPGAIKPGLKSNVSRDQAIELARSEFGPDALVRATLTPLDAGTLLEFENSSRRLTQSQWLFQIDPEPLSMLGHPLSYVLVNAENGEVERFEDEIYPVVNGQPIWVSLESTFLIGELDEKTLPVPLAEVVQVGSALQDPDQVFFSPGPGVTAQAAANNRADEVFCLLVVGNNSLRMERSAGALRSRLIAQGVPPTNIIIVSSQNPGAFAVFRGSKSRMAVETEIELALQIFKSLISSRLKEGKSSTFLYYHISHHVNGKMELANERYVAGQLKGLGILNTGACKTRLLLEGCTVAKFANSVANLARADATLSRKDIIIYTSTDSKTSAGIGHFGAYWSNAVAAQLTITAGDITGLATFVGGKGTAIGPASKVANLAGFGFAQNPQVIVVNTTTDPCPAPAPKILSIPERLPVNDGKISIFNQTPDRVEMEIESETGSLQGGKKVVLEPMGTQGDKFEQVLPGGAAGLNIRNFSPPSGVIDNLDGRWTVGAGGEQIFQWRETPQGGRTLIISQQ